MDFINEKHRTCGHICQNAFQILGVVKSRCTGHSAISTHLIGNDACQGGFTQTWRTDEERMVQGFLAFTGCLDEYSKVVLQPLLALEILEHFWSKDVLLFVSLLLEGGGNHRALYQILQFCLVFVHSLSLYPSSLTALRNNSCSASWWLSDPIASASCLLKPSITSSTLRLS